MRRKAKELQQARRDAERSGKKVPAFGGFGSAGMTSVSSGSIITDTIVEPEKPKITPAPVRYTSQVCFLVSACCCYVGLHYSTQGHRAKHWTFKKLMKCVFFFSDQVDQVRLWNWALKGKRLTILLTSWSLRVKPSCLPQEREARMYQRFCHHQSMWRGTDRSWFICLTNVHSRSCNVIQNTNIWE